MKHTNLIPVTAGLLILAGVALVMMTVAPAKTVMAHTLTRSYSWYIVPQGEGEQPIASDDAPFKDEYGVIYMGDPNEKTVWLTFDAGYDEGTADVILDALREKDVQAAFFICGNLIDRCPELVKRMTDEGHRVFNHTDKHRDMTGQSYEELEGELKGLEDKYRELTGREMDKVVRPPEGRYSEESLKRLRDMGYKVMFWSFAYKDWLKDAQPSRTDAVDTILSRAHPGMVALLHSNSATNAAILPDVIDALRAKGYRFGSIDELL